MASAIPGFDVPHAAPADQGPMLVASYLIVEGANVVLSGRRKLDNQGPQLAPQ